MKVFTIFLCIAISCVFGELERKKFEENLKVNEDTEKVDSSASLDEAKQTNSSDENLRGKYAKSNVFVQIPVSVQGAVLLEKETSKNLFSATQTSTVKPSSSKSIKNLEIMYLGKPAQYLRLVQNVTRPDITRPKIEKTIFIDFLDSFLKGADAVSRIKKNLVRNTRKFRRRKRMAEVKDSTDVFASLEVCRKLRAKFPVKLRVRLRKTDNAEVKLLRSYAKSKKASRNLTANYHSAKAEERKVLKEEVAAMGSGAKKIIDNYKALRKGSPWNHIKLRVNFKGFFAKPSAALTEYEELKRDELSSIDSFLAKSIKTESEKPKNLHSKKGEKAPKKKAEAKKEKTAHEAKKAKAIKAKNKIVKPFPKIQTHSVGDMEHSGSSYTNYLKLSEIFDADLQVQLMNTDAIEKRLLFSFMNFDYAPKILLDKYYAERKKEIVMLKKVLAASGPKAPKILASYKAARKGTIWNFLKNEDYKTMEYFEKPSAGRSEYEALKRKELDIDRYLNGSLRLEDEAPEKDEKAKAEEIRRASASEVKKAKQEEDDRSRAETAIKEGEDPMTVESSFAVMKTIRSKLPAKVRETLVLTDDAEEKLLESYAKTNRAKSNLIGDYTEAKRKEREALKEAMKEAGNRATSVIVKYKALRKGRVWNYYKLQDKYNAFFEKPSVGLKEYEKIKKDELSIGSYLKMPSHSKDEEENKEAKTEEDSSMARPEVAERARAEEEEERTEEMEREMRDRDIETLEAEEAVYRESAEDVVATIDETKGDIEMYGSPDSVTSADVTITKTATDTKAKNDSNLLRFAIFFAVVMQMIVAILILGPQSDKLVAWCRRMKRAEASPAETEALHAGNKSLLLVRHPKSRSLLSTSP